MIVSIARVVLVSLVHLVLCEEIAMLLVSHVVKLVASCDRPSLNLALATQSAEESRFLAPDQILRLVLRANQGE